MAIIQGIYAREILDSRGWPTIECTLWLDTGGIVATSVPTGTSIGKYEALEIRDKDPQRMLGKGVLTAVNYINTYIAPQIIGKDPTAQEEIDNIMIKLDGTVNKSKLGANSLLAISQAVLKAGALSQNVPLYYYVMQKYKLTNQLGLPTCIYSVVNGGEHGANNLDIQEFQIIPASHISFEESLEMAVTIFQKLEEVLILKGAIHSIGLVGGFTPNLYSNSDVFEIMVETIKATPYTFTQDLFFGVDVAAEQLYSNGHYSLKDRAQPFSGQEMLAYYKKLRDMYNVFYLEDPFQEDDLAMWKSVTAELGETTKIVGDSFLATNLEKLKTAIANKSCNTILVKPNQVGTISETIAVIKEARAAGWQVVMSHRSGETNDDFIADLAVGVGAEYAKFGPANRGERIAKYNRLAQINFEINQHYQQLQMTQPTGSLAAGPVQSMPEGSDPAAQS
ncbi:phosphopyruvate hydratase [Candidatus Woesebacteria bacterium]|nr:phosphopyruvate hydratase [Candidatus Woesebacteria bacterium]